VWGFFNLYSKENMETVIPRVTRSQIDALEGRIEYRYQVISGTTTTLCLAMLDGKFNLAIGKSACVDPRLYDAKIGESLALKDCQAQAINRLWELEGYRLYMQLRDEPELIAKVCHEANRAYCLSMGDNSHAPWEHAPEWQRVSARQGVEHHLSSDMSPEESHNSWLHAKEVDGWVYGETKDPVAKTHPCMVPYSQLPKEQQAKDYIFRAVVNAFKKAGEA
jgi:hypothetical protein